MDRIEQIQAKYRDAIMKMGRGQGEAMIQYEQERKDTIQKQVDNILDLLEKQSEMGHSQITYEYVSVRDFYGKRKGLFGVEFIPIPYSNTDMLIKKLEDVGLEVRVESEVSYYQPFLSNVCRPVLVVNLPLSKEF
jgi:hypothetical protein